jgi:hypothetical protein
LKNIFKSSGSLPKEYMIVTKLEEKSAQWKIDFKLNNVSLINPQNDIVCNSSTLLLAKSKL